MKFSLRSILRTALLTTALLAVAPPTVVAQQGGFYYTVQRGDSVSVVARRYNMSAAELARANRLQPTAALAAGSRLWIPRGSAATAARPSAPSSGAARQPNTSSLRTPTPRNTTASAPAPRAVQQSSNVYVVKSGDSLTRIGAAHGMSAQALANLNNIDVRKPLHVGQRLRITGGGAPSSSSPSPAPVVDVPGGGLRSEAPSRSTTSSTRPSSSGLIWPAEGRLLRRYTNRADEKYTGIDIALPKGTEVRAANEGKVVYAGSTIPSYGNMVIVSHGGNVATCYAHLDRILVREGQTLNRGQVLGRSGDSGRGNEPFLHFEVRRNGEAVNPEGMLP